MGIRRSWTVSAVTVAVLLMGAVTVAFGWYGIRVLTADGGGSAVAGRDAALMGLSGPEERTGRAMAAVVILVVTALTAVVTVGVARHRVGARHAAIMVFGVLGFLAVAAAVPGLAAEPPRPGAAYGVAVALVDVAIVALLLSPGTADAFEDAERERDRRALRR